MAMQALVMGFGGSGSHVLTALKELTALKSNEMPGSVRFLLFDTIADWRPGITVPILGGQAQETLAQANEEMLSLDPAREYFLLDDRDPSLARHASEFLVPGGNPQSLPHLRHWLHALWLTTRLKQAQLNIKEGAAQQRQIGRFAMFQNAKHIVEKVRQHLHDLGQQADGAQVNVWLMASAAGGTGAGCLLDAALLTRIAQAQLRCRINLSGVIVLPEVYQDKSGVSKARAFSLFRELARFQEDGFDTRVDRFNQISTSVPYDATNTLVAVINGRLFDNLFYLGRECRNDQARKEFFTSVANAIDPYLDAVAGRPLLQGSVNHASTASSMGAARAYLPAYTLAAIYAHEEVRDFISALVPVVESSGQPTDLVHGSGEERKTDARKAFSGLLPIFDWLLEQTAKQTVETVARATSTLDPVRLVGEHLQFNAASAAGYRLLAEDQANVMLTYCNPYISLTAPFDDPTAAKTPRVKTWGEMKAAGQKDADELSSMDRFHREMESTTSIYQTTEDASYSFTRGRKTIVRVIVPVLRDRIDTTVRQALDDGIAVDPQRYEAGTPLTRLAKTLEAMTGAGGPFDVMKRLLDQIKVEVDERLRRAKSQYASAQTELKAFKPRLFATTLPGLQQTSRQAGGDLAQAYQRAELVETLIDLLEEARTRTMAWRDEIKAACDLLVLSFTPLSVYITLGDRLKELTSRLDRMSRNKLASINLFGEPDPSLSGYRNVLKKLATEKEDKVTLSRELMAQSKWDASTDRKGTPRLSLLAGKHRFEIDATRVEGSAATLRTIDTTLLAEFKAYIDAVIEKKTVFDYLEFCQNNFPKFSISALATQLDKTAELLINSAALPERYLVYREPAGPKHQTLGREIHAGLGNVSVSVQPHSDPFSVTLLKVSKPQEHEVNNLTDCKTAYLEMQLEKFTEDEAHDEDLARAEVYHPFRSELEAWWIERRHLLATNAGVQSDPIIPPRLARLLDEPERMQLFVQALAVGVIVHDEEGWWWTSSDGNRIPLQDSDDESPDLVRAAVNFVLKGGDGRSNKRLMITAQEAQRTIAKAVPSGNTLPGMLTAFGKDGKIDAALAGFAPARETERQYDALKIILQYYSQPTMRTDIRNRMMA